MMFGGSPSPGRLTANDAKSDEASIRGKQIAAIKQMLRLNSSDPLTLNSSSSSSSSSSAPPWKVLIFDRVGQDILAPILSVKALREEGVTLHLNIASERDPVPDVPAIYFCHPTDENLRRISEDLRQQLYGSYYFNFISPISRQKLEDLATAAINANAVAQVHKLYDQYVDFICLENNLFTLRHQNSSSLSYHALNTSSVTDKDMENILTKIVDSLFSVFVTLGTVPIIRCPKGNAAEHVAKMLDKKLRENIRDARNSLFVSDGIQSVQFYRPVLILLDRQFDLATTFHHTWTYQALAHDVLQYSLNRVTITEELGEGRRKTRNCDLDNQDTFWCSQKGSPFPSVAERIQEELEDYKSKEEDIKRMKHEMGVEGESDLAIGMLSDNTQRLTSAVSNLPALLEKKRLIDMHTSIATSILEQIKHRRLDAYFELEEKIMSRPNQSLEHKKALLEMFQDPECGTPEDKMRIFIIFYLCSQNVPEEEIDKLASVLESCGCDMASLKYLRRWKSLSRITTSPTSGIDYGGGGTKTVGMFNKLMTHGSSFVMEGVKNLVVKKHNLPVTKIAEEIMEIRQGQYQDNFLYFDPKILRGSGADIPRAKNPFQEAVVFMVGGGNYIEYQNLLDFVSGSGKLSGLAVNSSSANLNASGSSAALSAVGAGAASGAGKKIVYGCTTLVNANQMMRQLAELGHEME